MAVVTKDKWYGNGSKLLELEYGLIKLIYRGLMYELHRYTPDSKKGYWLRINNYNYMYLPECKGVNKAVLKAEDILEKNHSHEFIDEAMFIYDEIGNEQQQYFGEAMGIVAAHVLPMVMPKSSKLPAKQSTNSKVLDITPVQKKDEVKKEPVTKEKFYASFQATAKA